jgi:hypothetical protein
MHFDLSKKERKKRPELEAFLLHFRRLIESDLSKKAKELYKKIYG